MELVFHWIQSIVVTSISVQRKIDGADGGMGWIKSVLLGQTTHIAAIASHNMLILFWSFLLILDMAHDPVLSIVLLISLNTFSFRPYEDEVPALYRIIWCQTCSPRHRLRDHVCAVTDFDPSNSAEIASGSQTWLAGKSTVEWSSLKPTFNGVSQLATFEYRRVYYIIIYYKYWKVINPPVDRHLLANSLANRCK